MLRLVNFVFANLVLLTACKAQDNAVINDPYSFIEKDAAIVCVCHDFGPVISAISESLSDDTPHWKSAVSLITNPVRPIIHQDRFKLIVESIERASHSIGELKTLVVAVYDFGDSPDYLIALKGSENQLEFIQNVYDEIELLLENSTEPLSKQADYAPSAKPVLKPDLQLQLSSRKTNEWLLFASKNERLNNVSNHIENNTGRSIFDERRFALLRTEFEKDSDTGLILEAIGIPSRLRPLFPDLSDSNWKALKVDDLPSFGIRVFGKSHLKLASQKQRDEFGLNFLVEGILRFTSPRTGFGKQLNSFKPIEEFPSFGVIPLYLRAESYDPFLKWEITKKLCNEGRSKGQPSFDEKVAESLKDDPRDFYGDFVPRVDATFSIGYKPDIDSPRQIFPLIIEHVADEGAEQRYVEGLVERANQMKMGLRQLERVKDIRTGKLFAINADSDNPGYTKSGFAEECYFYDQNWHLQGPYLGMCKQIDAFNENATTVVGQEWTKKFEYVRCLNGKKIEPFRVGYYSSLYWEILIDSRLPSEKIYRRREHQEDARLDDGDILEQSRILLTDLEIIEQFPTTKERIPIALSRLSKALLSGFGEQFVLFHQNDNRLRMRCAILEGRVSPR
jgi:hypothetical protein